MRVAIDARELCGRPTGVGRYLRELLDGVARQRDAHRHQWTLFAHGAPGACRVALDAGTCRRSAAPAAPGGNSGRCPRRSRADRPDVLFAPGYTAPLTVAAPGRDDSRRVVLRAPGVVLVPRGHAPPAAHGVVGAPRAHG